MWTVALALLLAQPANPYLEEARRLAKALKFADCIEQMKVASQVRDLPRAGRLEVLTLQARCQIAEGQRADAELSFAQLLELSPAAELDPKESPKILEVFAAVKQRLYAPDFARLSPQPARAGQAIFRLIDPWRRVESVVLLRRAEDLTHELRLMPVDEKVVVELEVAPGHSFDWWLEARDVSGQVISGFGSSQDPQRYSAPIIDTGPELVDTRTPRLQRVPAWIAAIVTVGACAVGAGLQVQSGASERQARDLSRPPGDWSDTARAAHATAITDASVATGLFIGAGVAGTAGVVLFAW